MIVCVLVYLALFLLGVRKRNKQVFRILMVANTIALLIFILQMLDQNQIENMNRNSYGGGDKVEVYEATVEGEFENESIEIEVGERQYSKEEIEEIFQEILSKLDDLIKGENKSLERVEKDLTLPKHIEGYPVVIQWELDNYHVLDTEGKIIQGNTEKEGTLVEVRGRLIYGEEEALYVTHVMVFPETKSEKETLIAALKQKVRETEKTTKKEKSFQLPSEIDGKKIKWEKKEDFRGYYVLVLGGCITGIILWKEKEDEKEKQKRRKDEMIRDYPEIISQFTLLLSTGMTIKKIWTKIVQVYEEQKEGEKVRTAYEEMCITYREMQSGVPEAEAYERFGKRCGNATYMKFGALLSQNIKKGSKGFVDILRLESIQAFENRKSAARQKGEEASTKLLLPMFGMLAIVMMIVIVPAFLSIQI